jgi:hypothetical protein
MYKRKEFLSNPTDIIHLGLSFVQKWKIFMKELERGNVEALVESWYCNMLRISDR